MKEETEQSQSSGKALDMLHGPLLKRIIFFALPETSCQGLFNQIHKKSTKRVPEALSGSGTQG